MANVDLYGDLSMIVTVVVLVVIVVVVIVVQSLDWWSVVIKIVINQLSV